MKTLITGGMVVTPHDTITADLLLVDGRVSALGNGLSTDGAEVFNASGKYVLPGGVDVHTHITLDIEATRGTNTYYTGTVPAAMGGTTTIVDHQAFGPEGCSPQYQVDAYHELATGKSVIDYGFHGVIQHVNDQTLADITRLFHEGYTSFKAYMTYDRRLDDASLLKLLRHTKKLGLILAVHCENHDITTLLRAECIQHKHTEARWHPKSRPAECEAEAINRVLYLAALADDAPIYIVHLSTALGLAEIQAARARGQKNILAETCTQYLTLTEQVYNCPKTGVRYIISPPLRTRHDIACLWQGLHDGDIQVVATDHCSFSIHDKERGLTDFTQAPGGAPGIEERMLVMFSEGVAQGRISINTFVETLCANPASIFGMYPHKGCLLPGADADVVIIDPAATSTMQAAHLHGPSDYSPYENMQITGRIDAVWLRGSLLARDNTFLGKGGFGHFLQRGRGMFTK